MQIRNVYGIDLGTSTVKIYDLKKDTITKEKNMIAIRNREQVIAVGNYAYEMHERTPSNIEVITPMSNGRIANVLMVEAVLHTLLHRCTRHMGYRPELYFSVPCDMTEIERRSYYTIAHKGALKNCRMYLVDKPIADALALGIPINRTKGSMIVNIGAQSTEISVIANARGYFFQNHPGRRKTVQRIDMQSEPPQKQFPDWLQNSQTCQDCAGGSWNRQKRGAEGARRRWCIRSSNGRDHYFFPRKRSTPFRC